MTDVLVIENSEESAHMLATGLILAGFQVKTAVGYREGIEKLSESIYKAIVLNPFFHDGSADDVFAKLTQDNLLSRVLVCSADEERVKSCIEQGIHAVRKPITLMQLGRLVDQIAKSSERLVGKLT